MESSNMAKTHSFLVICLLALALVRFAQAKCTNGNTFLGIKELTDNDKQKLLEYHNKFREVTTAGKAPAPEGKRQPQAANMVELTWDEHAAKQAYKWASGCEFKHNTPTDKDGNPLGQNLAVKMSTKKSNVDKTFDKWTKGLVKAWFNESNLYEFGGSINGQNGHYTQMVWANTTQVGCGYSYFKIDQNNQKWYAGYLVCNYNPAGNIQDENPYIEGTVNCNHYGLQPPSGKYHNLCKKK